MIRMLLDFQNFIETRALCYEHYTDPPMGRHDWEDEGYRRGYEAAKKEDQDKKSTDLTEGFNSHTVNCPDGRVVTIEENGNVSVLEPVSEPPKEEDAKENSDNPTFCNKAINTLARVMKTKPW